MVHGAGDGNRTHVGSLEGYCTTIVLLPLYRQRGLIIFRQDFVEGLGVLARRTFFRRFYTFDNIAAIDAVPLYGCLLTEYLAVGDIVD